MQHLEGSGTPILYIGRTVLKGYEAVWKGQNIAYFSGRSVIVSSSKSSTDFRR
jgi:hypothetical protein